MRHNGQTWDEVGGALQAIHAISGDLTISVVANLKSRGPNAGDYAASSVMTEYFSEDEAAQILLGLQEAGFYTKLYAGEREFIDGVLSGAFELLPRSRKLVYNTAQSGTGAGRKALIPAFCTLRRIPVCNSNAYVVSLARHKYHVYCILRSGQIPVTDSWLFDGTGWLFGKKPPVGVKLIAKACFESASIGLDADCVGELSENYEAMLREKVAGLRQPYIVQRFISGYEAEVPVIELRSGAVALEPVAVTLDGNRRLGERYLDYAIVENDLWGFADCDHLAEGIVGGMRATAEGVFRILGMLGIGRIDFRIDGDGMFSVTDVSTTPHLVRHSSFAYAFERAGQTHSDLLATVVGVNARRFGWC